MTGATSKRLTSGQVKELRELHADNWASLDDLAHMYGISVRTAYGILRGDPYRPLDDLPNSGRQPRRAHTSPVARLLSHQSQS